MPRSKPKKCPFSYTLRDGRGRVCKEGKGTAEARTKAAVQKYFRDRGYTWVSADVEWHDTGSAALKAEKAKEDAYLKKHGRLPSGSKRRAGGGRRAEAQCKATKKDGSRCANPGIKGNYGYCGVHR